MGRFRYAARDERGRAVNGSIQASDRAEALTALRSQNLVVVSVDEGLLNGPQRPKIHLFSRLVAPRPKSSLPELVMFTRQLSTMCGAGLSTLEGIEILAEQADSPGMQATCNMLSSSLREGASLSEAMKRCPRSFGSFYVSMIAAGEASGRMDEILERLADSLESGEAMRRDLRAAMTYPLLSLALVLGVSAFLMIGIVPGFRDVFREMGVELNGLTAVVLDFSDTLRRNWHVPALACMALVVALVSLRRTGRGGLLFDGALMRLPLVGILLRKVSIARFSRTFATLIQAGVPILSALEIVAATTGNRVVERAVRHSEESVRTGRMLSEPLGESRVFPPMVVRMIAVGERSGSLDVLLEKIAVFYDAQVRAQVKALTSLVEPLIVVVMGGLVGTVVLAVFLPILDVVGSLSN